MIVVLTQCFPPDVGGIEVLMGGLADALAEIGREVIVMADGHRDSEEPAHDGRRAYPVRRFAGFKPWRRRRKALGLGKLLRSTQIEAVYADTWKSAEHAIDNLEGHAVPLVCLAHGNDVLAQGKARRRRRIVRVLSKARRVAANSSDTARRVRELGIAPDRIAVVNPGVTPPHKASAETHRDMAARIGAGGPVLVTVARLEPRKGQDQVLRSLPGLVVKHPSLVYAVAGDGPYRGPLEKLTRELGVESHVRFLGRVSEDDKAAILELADLFVMPVREDTSGHSVEGFGIAYVEAAFCAVPAVAGFGGGAADAVVDGETGLLCDGDDPGDVERAIRDCLVDPGQLGWLGDTARRRAQREFSWTAAVTRYLACLGPASPDKAHLTDPTGKSSEISQ